MFENVFVYDSQNPSSHVERARAKGFRMVDVRESGTTVHGGNPRCVVYDVGTRRFEDDILYFDERFLPPKHTGVMVLFREGKGNIRALPDRVAFVEWFFDKRYQHWNSFTGNFRI